MNYLAWLYTGTITSKTLLTHGQVRWQLEDVARDMLAHNSIRLAWYMCMIAGVGILGLLIGIYFSKSRLFRRMALYTVQDTQQGYTAPIYPKHLIGTRGTAQTPLRPAGKVMIDGNYYDVTTLGIYVEPQTTIIVTDVVGPSLIVRPI